MLGGAEFVPSTVGKGSLTWTIHLKEKNLLVWHFQVYIYLPTTLPYKSTIHVVVV